MAWPQVRHIGGTFPSIAPMPRNFLGLGSDDLLYLIFSGKRAGHKFPILLVTTTKTACVFFILFFF
jgi:hypothetical protein